MIGSFSDPRYFFSLCVISSAYCSWISTTDRSEIHFSSTSRNVSGVTVAVLLAFS